MGLRGPKSRCQQGWLLLEAPGESLFPCLFPLPEASCTLCLVPLLYLQSWQQQRSHLCFCPHVFSDRLFRLPFSLIRTRVNYMAPMWITQGHILISRSLTQLYLPSPFCLDRLQGYIFTGFEDWDVAPLGGH